MVRPLVMLVLAAVGGCSPETAPAGEGEPAVVAMRVPPSPRATTGKARRGVLTLRGLDALVIGQAVPARSGWGERGAQIDGGCRTVSSPEYPGVHAIVIDGIVRRITVGRRSAVKLAEGIGVGAGEAAVRTAFGRLRESPHAYQARPARYLTMPVTADDAPALRFEIGTDGRVALMHVGTMPTLANVEGCA